MNVSAISSITRVGLNSTSSLQGANSSQAIGSNNLAGAVDGSNGQQAPGGSFVDTLGQAFTNLNSQLNGADATMANFASGGSADLHTVMLQMEEASISLKVGTQVRDKLLEAYQDIMRTQI